MKRSKPEIQAALNATSMFFAMHFYKSGPPQGVPADIAESWANISIQAALMTAIQRMGDALKAHSRGENLRDNAERQVVTSLLALHGEACIFAKWSSLWANFVYPKVSAGPGLTELVWSPGKFEHVHEILCCESADRFRVSWDQFVFWYQNQKYQGNSGSWPMPEPSSN